MEDCVGDSIENNLNFLIHLKKLKKDGTLDSETYFKSEECRWRNSVDYKTLEHWLTINNEELRLNTLELLIISKKSTLFFIKEEFDLIKLFLKYNFREKIEYVPLIKKVLKRLNESYAVLRRQLEKENKLKELQKLHPEFEVSSENLVIVQKDIQIYQEFVRFLHEICLKNLYSGAVNVRRKSSLQILCLMNELLSEDLKCSLWNLDDFKVLFDCLLLDTYEVNKHMAFTLIQASKHTELFFDTEEKILDLINVAIEMGNSIRPLDSITAAYMYKISMLASNVQKVLIQLLKVNVADNVKENTTFYMISLLKQCLEKPVKLATKNIVIAASKHSLYGYVFCIHNILSNINLKAIVVDERWRNLLSEIVNMCFELTKAVSQIVNNSSPEGHLPMDLNPQHLNHILQDAEDTIITSQMVLLCSWRTVKEISLFFGYLTSNASIYNNKIKNGLISEDQVKEIGNQLVILLCETKHRGAFEQAHVGFGQLCNRLWHLNQEHEFLRQSPKIWLQQLLLDVVGQTSENSKLCATRRSAGVPFMVQALVTSEIVKKHSDPKTLIFHSVMRILLKLVEVGENLDFNTAQNLLYNEDLFQDYQKQEFMPDLIKVEIKTRKLNEITEIKTHALNILRALFRHCLLGELVKDYIAQGFIAAFKSYDGKSWAERNAATLLFSSLVIRVFGVQRTKDHVNLTLHNRMTGKNFFEKFPSLLLFLLNELTAFVNDSEIEIKPKIQSILLILSRLYPGVSSEDNDEDWKIDTFVNLVSKCGKSRVYKTRELAARALVPLLTEETALSVSCGLLKLMTISELPINSLHGYTLQLLEIVRNQQFINLQLPQNQLQNLFTILNTKILLNLESSNSGQACYPVATGILEILIEVSRKNPYSWIYKDAMFLKLLEKIQSHLILHNLLKKRPGVELYEVTAANLIISVIENENYTGLLINNEFIANQLWERLLNHGNPDVLIFSWSKLICIIQKMNSTTLYDLGFMTASKVFDQPIDNPDLKDSVFEFICEALEIMETNVEYVQYTFSNQEEKICICKHIFNKLCEQVKLKTFYPKEAFFKLFGIVFGFLLKNCNDSEFSEESKKIIYDTFLNETSMESNIDCRIGISKVLFNIYIDINKINDMYFILDWWTALFRLLYDDNFQVRSNAALIVCKLEPKSELQCEAIILDTFFEKFVSIVGQNVEAVFAAFFCWCMTSAAVVLEEMDESDVFNKSCNYECFEPIQITKYCIKHLKDIVSKQNLRSTVLSKSVKKWLQEHLIKGDSIEFESLSELIIRYKKRIPETELCLSRILDPTYPAKEIKEMAYIEFRKTVIQENGIALRN